MIHEPLEASKTVFLLIIAHHSLKWVAVKELKLTYYSMETPSLTLAPCSGNVV